MNETGDCVDFYKASGAATPTAPPQNDMGQSTSPRNADESYLSSESTQYGMGPTPMSSPGNGDASYSEPPSYIECTTLTEKEVREALEDYVRSDCCALRSALQDMKILEIQSKPAYRYTLYTFSEYRSLTPESEPYKRSIIPSPLSPSYSTDIIPDQWSFAAVPPASFAEASRFLELPGSSSITECTSCQTTGFIICPSCKGLCFVRCETCNGSGRVIKSEVWEEDAEGYINCPSCSGLGRSNCGMCQIGRVRCEECDGHMFMRHWQNLQIQWKTSEKTFETPRGELPKLLLEMAQTGGMVLNERCTVDQAQPIVWHKDPTITAAANRLVRQSCSTQNEDKKILEFCQQVEVIPVVEVTFELDRNAGKFHIIGMGRRVNFPQGYPRNCCSIL